MKIANTYFSYQEVMAENNNIGVGFGILILRNGKVLLGQRHMDPTKADSELHGE